MVGRQVGKVLPGEAHPHRFVVEMPDGSKDYLYRDEFYVPPTAEEIAMKLSLVRFSDEESDRMIELTMREAWPLAAAVVELFSNASTEGDHS